MIAVARELPNKHGRDKPCCTKYSTVPLTSVLRLTNFGFAMC